MNMFSGERQTFKIKLHFFFFFTQFCHLSKMPLKLSYWSTVTDYDLEHSCLLKRKGSHEIHHLEFSQDAKE